MTLAETEFSREQSRAAWRGRQTRAEVDLGAIASNVREIRRVISGARLMTVVKANAYGHGSIEVARTALLNGAEWLGVYTVDEATVLRRAGIAAPILVFGPFGPGEAATFWQHRMVPTIADIRSAHALVAESSGEPLSVHIKVDTGLARAGVAETDAMRLFKELEGLPNLRVDGLYTHFARADESASETTHKQLDTFRRLARLIEVAAGRTLLKHCANSAGILNFPSSHMDMVRCGISTYGYYPSDDSDRRAALQPALTLVSTVVRVRTVQPGEGVGYGHEFRSETSATIALVPVGYGDGLSRSLGNGRGFVLIRGTPAPIVGRVSMDQITVDVGHTSGVSQGDEVVLIGRQHGREQSAEDMGSAAGTISYDVLTALMPRVPRQYLRNGNAVVDWPQAADHSDRTELRSQ